VRRAASAPNDVPSTRTRSQSFASSSTRPRKSSSGISHGPNTRGHGGYVVAAGSTNDTGRYTANSTLPPQQLPDWITTHLYKTSEQTTRPAENLDLKDTSAYALAALTGELQDLPPQAPGTVAECVPGRLVEVEVLAARWCGDCPGCRYLVPCVGGDQGEHFGPGSCSSSEPGLGW
jgi:hypothetical protein